MSSESNLSMASNVTVVTQPEPYRQSSGGWLRTHWRKAVLGVLGVSLVLAVTVATAVSVNSQSQTPGSPESASVKGPRVLHRKTHEKPEPTLGRFTPKRQDETVFSLDDMFNSSFRPRGIGASWFRDTNKVTYINQDGELVKHDADTDEAEVIMPVLELSWQVYEMSPDERYILLCYELDSSVQDYSLQCKYKIYDTESGDLLDFPNDDEMRDQELQLAFFDGSFDDTLVFIFGDDLYLQDNPTAAATRLTTTGEPNRVRNGMSFWNYRGVLWDRSATWFSPDQSLLAYGTFNSPDIVLSEFPVYGDFDKTYPDMFRQTYLKSGDPDNFSYGRLLVRDLSDDSEVEIEPPAEFADQDHYFYRVVWMDTTHLFVAWSDRSQQNAIFEICDVTTQSCIRHREESATDGWLEGSGAGLERFIDGGTNYLAVKAKETTNGDHVKQVVLVTSPLDGPGELTYVTDSVNMVWSVLGFDDTERRVYFRGTNGNDIESQIFVVSLPEAGGEPNEAECLTCDLAEDCTYNFASFSASTDFLFLSCNGPDIPRHYVRSTRSDWSFTVTENDALRELLLTKKMPTREWHLVELGDGYVGSAELVLPPDMVTDGSVLYPMILAPYGGPHGHVQASYSYKEYDWETYLASSENVITARINGRGAGGREEEFLFALYRGLGTHEIQDQIHAARYIRDNYAYIDPDRIAIWGWSYGGFVASHVIGDETNDITCGLAVAPVTNFRFYYSGYTERYMDMDTPEDNQAGYDGADVMRKVENFRNKNFFVAHGTLDDNVHYQNAAQLIKALTRADIAFKQETYVDENHGISLSRRHLYSSLSSFLLNECNFGETRHQNHWLRNILFKH